MKELNAIEMQEVSGAGILSTAGSMVGAGIGSILDAITPGESTLMTDACKTIGRFIGAIAENPLGIFGVILSNLLSRNNG
ncbi:hypothetical protein [Kosakonia oryzae]|uniref:hypothetical protein n=1 Tax=Kosakonia oryzae TaxID=497725 RepID=UPI001D089916|nr:hypothetical protein [Kosakonia oryzae]UDJ84914.1 hypothetical protein I5186_12900 [Kosakonia oryzae]